MHHARLTPPAAPRALGAGLAVSALLVSLCAPWYVERSSAPGLPGRHTLVQSFSGWQALSGPALVCVIVALVLAALAALRLWRPAAGLGAAARATERARIDAALVTAGGIACVIAILVTIAAPVAVAAPSAVAHVSCGARWGTGVSLLCAAGLTLVGARMLASAGLPVAGLIRRRTSHRTPAPARPRSSSG